MSRFRAFLLGIKEFRSSLTTSFSDLDLQDAYDLGREWAHRLTFRYWES